jgi:hypothetical protein
MWLRYVENLRGEEEVVHIYVPEHGKTLSDDEGKRSENDLRNFQVGSEELSSCQVGNEKRSLVDLKYFQVSSNEISDFQVGDEMGSLVDLIDCQGGSRKFPNFQVGREKVMRLS